MLFTPGGQETLSPDKIDIQTLDEGLSIEVNSNRVNGFWFGNQKKQGHLEEKVVRVSELKKNEENDALNRPDWPAFRPIKMARFLTGPDIRDRRNTQRIVIEAEGGDLQVKYGVRSDAAPVRSRFSKDEHDFKREVHNMMISLLGVGSYTLLADFDAAGINYVRCYPEPGQIMNAGEWVEIAKVSVTAIASVLVAWISARASRKVLIALPDKRTFAVEGRSVDEVERLLSLAMTITALETKKPDSTKDDTQPLT